MQKIFRHQTIYSDIFLAIATSGSFSAFIYLSHFGVEIKLLNSLLALLAFWLFLAIPKRAVLLSGFFIGLFWFYWISFSFKYNGVGYIAPFIILGFGIIYMLFFAPLALTTNPLLRALFLFALSFFAPMDFNWMQLPLPFLPSYFGVQKWQFGVILLSLAATLYFHDRRWRFAPLVLLLLALDFKSRSITLAPLKIKTVQTNVKQELKWKKEQLRPTIVMIYQEILKATKEGYDVVVLPESVVPLYLNKFPKLIDQFQELSKDINIVLGALYLDGKKHYNVTYYFKKDGSFDIAKKVVLVPFGEYIPLPKFLQDFVNEHFFAGASDFVTAKNPHDFIIEGIKFRNAICYEATHPRLYEDNPKFMIAISNNAWFAPSIEPTLQHLLLRYYATLHNTIIYHSTNSKGAGVITPKP